MSILRLYQYLETKRQSKHSTGRCSKDDSGERCHEEAHMHQDPSGMLARIPFGLTTGPIEGAEILVAGCRKETVASEMRSNVLKYRDTLIRHTTGEARVIPILLKPTPSWETTPLGALQALPTDAKPITAWSSRDKALADVVEGLRRAVEAVQKQDRYPVIEYQVHIQTVAYITLEGERLQREMPAEEEAFHTAELWLETLPQIGVREKNAEDEQRQEWIITDH